MDAMSGRGELGDWSLVVDLYGLGGLGGIQDWADSGRWGGQLGVWGKRRLTGRNTGLGGIRDGVDWGGRGIWGGLGSLGWTC